MFMVEADLKKSMHYLLNGSNHIVKEGTPVLLPRLDINFFAQWPLSPVFFIMPLSIFRHFIFYYVLVK